MGRFVKFIKFFGAVGYLYGAGARVQGGGGRAMPCHQREGDGKRGYREIGRERATTIRKDS